MFQHLTNLQEMILISPNVISLNLSFLAHLNSNFGVNVRLTVPSDITVFDILQDYVKHRAPPFSQVTLIDLTGNDILSPLYTSIVPVFTVFPNTKHLIMDNCEITSLPSNFFFGLKNIEILSINFTGLKNIPTKSLLFLSTLEQLSLNNNLISSLEEKSFIESFKNLTYLSLAFNSITDISPGFFRSSRLEHLDLRNNPISFLNSSVLSPSMLPYLKCLDLRWNNLDCSCNAWFPSLFGTLVTRAKQRPFQAFYQNALLKSINILEDAYLANHQKI